MGGSGREGDQMERTKRDKAVQTNEQTRERERERESEQTFQCKPIQTNPFFVTFLSIGNDTPEGEREETEVGIEAEEEAIRY